MTAWKLVPAEPDWNMTTAAGSSIWDTATENHHKLAELAVRNAIAASPDPAEDVELIEHVAAVLAPGWFTPLQDGVHPLDNYPKQHEGYRTRARSDARAVLRLLSGKTP